MIATNELLNRINDWNAPEQNAFKRHIGSRFTNLCATAPIQTIAIAQNILIVPFQVVGITLNLAAKTIAVLSCSDALKDFRANMPTLSDLARTVARIFLYAVGTVFTATIGVLSPNANFKIQCALGLAINEREEALRLAFIEAEVEKLNELAAKNQIDQLLDHAAEKAENVVEIVQDEAVKINNILQQETEKVSLAVQEEAEKLKAAVQEEAEKLKAAVQEEVEKIVVESPVAYQEELPNENAETAVVSTVVVDDQNNIAEFTETVVIEDNNEANVSEVAKNADAEMEDDVLIDFEGIEDTALTKAVQAAYEKGTKAVDDSVNFISGLVSKVKASVSN